MMIKKELAKLRTLKATPTIMQVAANDTPVERHRYYWNGDDDVYYKINLYMRCVVQNGILKVALFLPEHLRAGKRIPAYEIYVDRDKKQFLTYNTVEKKWQTARVNMLDWPRSCYHFDEKWISKADFNTIQSYLGGARGGYDGLLDFQNDIRKEALELRHKKITDRWDVDMARVPALPKDWERWVSKVAIPENYIFYKYKEGGAKTGYCSHCDMDVPIKNPRYNTQGRCPRCRHEITFKSIGKVGYLQTNRVYMYLIQRLRGGGFVIREFLGRRFYHKSYYMMPKIAYTEIRRVFYNEAAEVQKAYNWGLYRLRKRRWILGRPCTANWWRGENGKVYGKTLPSLSKRELKETGLVEALKHFDVFDPEYYLAANQEFPLLERLVKANMMPLVYQCLTSFFSFTLSINITASSSLTKALGIDKQKLKRLREHNCDWKFLYWLQYEKLSGKLIPDETILWLCKPSYEKSIGRREKS